MYDDNELLISRTRMYVQCEDTLTTQTYEFLVKMDISMAHRKIITPDIIAA